MEFVAEADRFRCDCWRGDTVLEISQGQNFRGEKSGMMGLLRLILYTEQAEHMCDRSS